MKVTQAYIRKLVKEEVSKLNESHIDPVSDPRFSKIAIEIFRANYPRVTRNTLMSRFNFNGDDDMKLLAKLVNAPVDVVTADYENAIEGAKKKLGITESDTVDTTRKPDDESGTLTGRKISEAARMVTTRDADKFIKEVLKLGTKDNLFDKFIKSEGIDSSDLTTLVELVSNRLAKLIGY